MLESKKYDEVLKKMLIDLVAPDIEWKKFEPLIDSIKPRTLINKLLNKLS
jgi:hypothetical protein